MCARTLAGRLLQVIHFVVHSDQTCGILGCYIGTLLICLLNFTFRLPFFLSTKKKLSIELTGAFSLLPLKKMGFGPSFIRWVRVLYSKARCSILVNGYSCPVFYPTHGVRQGSPLSPLLYVLTMEVLACNLRAHPDLVGIKIPNSNVSLPVVSLSADDTSAIVISDPGINTVFETYSGFEKASGSRLNLSKCKGLWLGS